MRKCGAVTLGVFLLVLFLYPGNGRTVLPADASAEIPEKTKYIALTFDDGPRQGTTEVLLDGLRQRGASATFFVVGEQAILNPDLVRRMKAEGHQVGNHTWSHLRLAGKNTQILLEDVERADALLQELLGKGNYWLRPPYGMADQAFTDKITVPMVKWSVDPRDWERRNTDAVFQAILKDTRANSIVLLHDIYPTSVEAALKAVDELQEKGYVFVTVEELLLLNGVKAENGTMYRSGNP